jgi:hypothetical protein
MAYIADLNGKISNYNGDPIEGSKISVYRKVGEILSDQDGNYSNIQYEETEEYIVGCEKENYYTVHEEYPLNGLLNIILPKNDELVEPVVPPTFQIVDYETGNSVLITWEKPLFDFIRGYNIYRSENIQDIFEKVNNNIIIDDSYIDAGIEPFKDYYYILEVISANGYSMRGETAMTSIAGPISVDPILQMEDITESIYKVKVDSTKTNKELEKLFDNNDDTWWESQRGEGCLQ